MLSVEKEFEFICPAVHNVTLPIECAYLQSAPVGDTPPSPPKTFSMVFRISKTILKNFEKFFDKSKKNFCFAKVINDLTNGVLHLSEASLMYLCGFRVFVFGWI